MLPLAPTFYIKVSLGPDLTFFSLIGNHGSFQLFPQESDGVNSVIVVDGIPCVGAERTDKLKNVIRKVYSKFGKLVHEHYPVDEEGNTKIGEAGYGHFFSPENKHHIRY